MELPSVSVVVPALNEAQNIPHVFARMPLDVHEVILVDGFSVDETVAVARQVRPDVRVIQQSRKGKGNALACGIAVATGDVIALVDADGSADPSEIPQFVEALINGADFAKGTRFAEGGGSADITRLRSYGNYALTAFFNACYGRNYSDLCYGFNVFEVRGHPGWQSRAPAERPGRGREKKRRGRRPRRQRQPRSPRPRLSPGGISWPLVYRNSDARTTGLTPEGVPASSRFPGAVLTDRVPGRCQAEAVGRSVTK